MPLNMEAFASCVNLGREVAYILENKLATYSELDSQLTLEDALNIIEAHKVSQHNQSLMEELRRELSNRR